MLRSSQVKTLIVGVGSTIRRDDGVGMHAVRAVRDWLEKSSGFRSVSSTGNTFRRGRGTIDVAEVGTAGVSLLDLIDGYDRLIVLDAIETGAEPGSVMLLTGDEFARSSHPGACHEADLPAALALGRKLVGGRMPSEIFVVAVEVKDTATFSEEPTPEVERSLPEAVRLVAELVEKPLASRSH